MMKQKNRQAAVPSERAAAVKPSETETPTAAPGIVPRVAPIIIAPADFGPPVRLEGLNLQPGAEASAEAEASPRPMETQPRRGGRFVVDGRLVDHDGNVIADDSNEGNA